MEKFEIQINLEHIKDAKAKAVAANREFLNRVDKALTRLIYEGAAARMSAVQIAKLSGFSTAQIKARMKNLDLNPTNGKTLLSRHAAAVLEHNAEILGIRPADIDLMSPLAYLPAGNLLKAEVSSVTEIAEFPETSVIMTETQHRDLLTKAYGAGYADRGGEVSYRPDDIVPQIMAQADEAGA